MENILVKRKEFNILEKLTDKTFKVERKGKIYFAKVFETREAFEDFIYAKKHIYLSGVTTAKLILKDKKTLTVLTEFIEGKSALQALIDNDINDTYYELIFINSYRAKLERISLDFSPEHWILSNDKLYYMETIMMPFEKELSFTEKYIRLWFNTKELKEHLTNLNIDNSSIQIKSEYETNKEIVLKTCRFYN